MASVELHDRTEIHIARPLGDRIEQGVVTVSPACPEPESFDVQRARDHVTVEPTPLVESRSRRVEPPAEDSACRTSGTWHVLYPVGRARGDLPGSSDLLREVDRCQRGA